MEVLSLHRLCTLRDLVFLHSVVHLSSFGNGLVSATVPVALAYVSDVYEDRKKKDREIGIIIGMFLKLIF